MEDVKENIDLKGKHDCGGLLVSENKITATITDKI